MNKLGTASPNTVSEAPALRDIVAHEFQIIGVDHRTCPDDLRELLFVDDSEVQALLNRLRDEGLEECLVLSTCDRVEVLSLAAPATDIEPAIATALAAPLGMDGDSLRPHFYRKSSRAAVHHLFRVAASLDSQVVGEPQVLGQVKAAHRLAKDLGFAGPKLEPIFQAAFQAAKRARSETRVGEGPVSIAAAAVGLSRDLHGDLGNCGAVLIGAGEMGVLLSGQLQAAGLGRISVVDHIERRAAKIASDLTANQFTTDDLSKAMEDGDILVVAAGAPGYAVNADMIEAVLKVRRRRPIFVIDLSVPGDVEPSVSRIDEAFVYDLDDLEQIALEGRTSRTEAADHAELLIEAEVTRFLSNTAEREAGDLIEDMRAHFESVRRAISDERPGLDGEEAMRLLANRLLHQPSKILRQMAADGLLDDQTENQVRRLIGLADLNNNGEDT